MSRGHGRWQKVVLEALAAHPQYDVFPLSQLVREHLGGDEPTRSEMVAARRALKTLAMSEEVRAIYRPPRDADGKELPGPSLLCATRFDSPFVSDAPRIDAPGWITWLDGKTDSERAGSQ